MSLKLRCLILTLTIPMMSLVLLTPCSAEHCTEVPNELKACPSGLSDWKAEVCSPEGCLILPWKHAVEAAIKVENLPRCQAALKNLADTATVANGVHKKAMEGLYDCTVTVRRLEAERQGAPGIWTYAVIFGGGVATGAISVLLLLLLL